MAGEFTKELSNGNKVVLANWEHYEPTEHGQKLRETAWNQANSRQQLGFYDATTEYMRNDWAFRNMDTAYAKVDGKSVVLFHSPETGQWHTTDALDIDHKTPWKEYLSKLDTKTVADAHMGYNDISNLRMLPSAFNRARESAENIVNKYGQDSPQWNEWTQKRFSFDNTMQIRDFDPESDGARRTKTTINQVWDESNKRSELKFDKAVVEKWFESELHRLHAGNVKITSSDGQKTWDVPLFRCTATGQLVTRDAFDIDHVLPFEQLNKKMLETHGTISKANALDAYNDTSNLRLVGRSANSSHEWEIGLDGRFRDKVVPKEKGEFDDFLDKAPSKGVQGGLNLKDVLQQTRIIQEHMVEDYFRKSHAPSMQPPSQQHGPLQHGPQMPQPVGPLLSDTRHPDHPMYAKILGDIAKHDPKQQIGREQRETMASSMVVFAKHMGLERIDQARFETIQDKVSLAVTHGKQMQWLSVDECLQGRSLRTNTGALELQAFHQHLIEQRGQQQNSGPQTVNVQLQPQQQGTHQLSGLPSQQQHDPHNVQQQTGNTQIKHHF